MKRILIEILLILALSLLLAVVFNAVSPSGLRIMPRKEVKKAEAFKERYLLVENNVKA